MRKKVSPPSSRVMHVTEDSVAVVDVFTGGIFNVHLLRILARRTFIYGGTVVRRK